MCTQILADRYNVDAVINTGVAGSLNNDIDICDIVISTVAQEHDMDVTALGYEKGIIPDMDVSIFEADRKLVEVRWHIRLIAQIVIVHFSMQVKVHKKECKGSRS